MLSASYPSLPPTLGHVHVNETYWYLEAVPELLQLATQTADGEGQGGRIMIANSFPALLQSFFTQRMLRTAARKWPHHSRIP